MLEVRYSIDGSPEITINAKGHAGTTPTCAAASAILQGAIITLNELAMQFPEDMKVVKCNNKEEVNNNKNT